MYLEKLNNLIFNGNQSNTFEKQRLLKVFIDTIDVMDIAMWELDLDYRVISFNRKAREIYGEEAKGDFCYHIAAGLNETCPRCPAKKVYEGSSSGRSEHKRTDASTGTTIYIDHIATPIRNKQGKLTGALVLIIDITKHKELENKLKRHQSLLEEEVENRTQELLKSEHRFRGLYKDAKRNEELYRSVLSSSADAIVVYDLTGLALYINPAFTRIFGWEFEELRGKKIPFLPESEKKASMKIIVSLLKDGTPCHGFETRRYTKGGRVLDVSLSASRYHDHQGEPAGMLVILRDISKNKQMEAQLKQAERLEAIGTLAGGIAHDFNNLMMGIMGNVSLMLLDTSPHHHHYEKLKKIEKMIQSGARLTSQLLGYARKGQYEVTPLDLNRIIQNSTETFSRTRKEISITTELEPHLPMIKADESQIEQILLNLFVNAADAMPEGGCIEIKTVREKNPSARPADALNRSDVVLLQVADNGSGIDEEIIDHIFEPFFTTKGVGHGTGMGLASVYGIVQGHGGHIQVDSKKGEGTVFSIYFPAMNEKPSSPSIEPKTVKNGDGTILLVDDEKAVLEVGKQMLQRLGYKVLIALDGKEAIRQFENFVETIDLVILDMILPGISGGDIFKSLKKREPDIKILLSSGYSLDGQAKDLMNQGCDGFLQKPFRLQELSGKINDILLKNGPAQC